ncbi:MAG: energy-coupling factor transporter transmembrane protein EcfT [Propionibacteriaceae bacterium]|jgi:energy-coupling factor transport system permease protein|nr:energy-coupling factor transporter transmembrane protein EcfT [Propionibacteriaceae bacterium]
MAPELFRLDPRTTLLLVALLNVVMFSAGFTAGAGTARLIFMAIPPVLAVGLRRWKAALVYLALVGPAFAFESWSLDTWWLGGANIVAAGLASLAARLAPGIFMAYIAVISIRVSELMAGLEAIHLPRLAVIPAAVILRFLPTVREESRSVQIAMNARGLSLARVGPLAWLEYRLIPLIMSTLRCGEELSQAALTRGLGRPVKANRIARIGMRPADVLTLGAMAAGIGVWIVG